MNKPLIYCSALFLCVAAAQAETPWCQSLYLANQGYWPTRLPIEIENTSNEALVGEPVETSVAPLAGASVVSLRVCRADGVELLFDLRDAAGRAKRAGGLSPDDRLILPVDCPARGKCALLVYAGNEHAWPVPDYLASGFRNGQFELGEDAPEGWRQGMGDALHVLRCVADEGRANSRCAKAEVADGAGATWVQWQQPNIPVTPGRAYRFTGWVRARDVVGQAGWYVHVNGAQPQMINKTLNAGGGTFAWRSVSTEFTAPPGANTATVGTVLHGAGTAWYDDAQFVDLSRATAVAIKIGAVEQRRLTEQPGRRSVLSREWPGSCQFIARNFANRPIAAGLVRCNLRSALARLPNVSRKATARVTDDQGVALDAWNAGGGGDLLFATDFAASAQRRFNVDLHATARIDAIASDEAYGRLLGHQVNLARNGDFEVGESLPDAWLKPEPGAARARVLAEARFGKRSLELVVPHGARANWVGWRSPPIPVRPGASYFLSGWLRALDVRGTATIHAHFHTAAGGLTQSGAMVSTHPSVSGDSDWVHSSAVLQAPADAASIVLHLTTNATGTLRHDAVLLAEVLPAQLAEVRSARDDSAAGPLDIWQVNSLVKVFPETPPGVPARDLQLELARNEYEPLQIALRAHVDVARQTLRVHVSELRDDAGHVLPPVKIERVGFVPIDHPSGYYRSDVPDWCRRIPYGQGATDGWAGLWPDPLVPVNSWELAAGVTQPLWLTVHAPEQAVAGDYRGAVQFRCGQKEVASLPLRVRVLPFALPAKTQLRAILDFRFGPGGTFGSGADSPADRRRWLRFMAERRLSIDQLRPPEFTYADGKVAMDAREFDDDAAFCFDELGMNVAYTPRFFYMFGWAYPPKKFFGLEPFTPEWETAFRQAYQLFADHVRARGWHDKFVYYISDEPHFDRDFVVQQMRKLCALIHDVDPKIPIYSSTWRHCPAWDESLDIWGVGQYGCFPVAEMEQRLRAGKRIWFTCDGQMATDTPLLATERMLPYYCLKYGAAGFEFWGLAWWTYDPWQRGWHTFIRQSDDGKRHYWVRYPDGDGYLAYPGRAVGVDGPVTTIRLEQVREGLEDSEALLLLSRMSEQAKARGQANDGAERALRMARDMVAIPNAGGLRSTEILPEPDRLMEVRRAVNAAIVDQLGAH